MLFNSLPFLFGYLPATLLVFWELKSKRGRYAWLAVTGYLFYAAWDWRFCSLMMASTCVSFGAGLGLQKTRSVLRRRLLLTAAIAFDLSMLGYFKYANFAGETLAALGLLSSGGYHPLNIVLPVGISFYTFHTITYVVDVYRGDVRPTRDLLEFSCYVSFFAQLVAGPIVRFRQIEQDLEQLDVAQRGAWADRGWSLFCVGLMKKVVIADALAALVNPTLVPTGSPGLLPAWSAMLGYSYQLYFDFSGYSDMALGLGLLFGLRLPLNFDSPYQATDPSDFWRRWHISLSTVLRDYLYKPLGGNRQGAWRTRVNLMITMLLGGLWHGANWTFVAWGAWHGALLVLFRPLAGPWKKLPLAAQRAGTFLLVVIGWTFFRASSLDHACRLFAGMAGLRGTGAAPAPALVAMLLIAALVAHGLPRITSVDLTPRPWRTVALTTCLVACMAVMYVGAPSPFLYFQF